jgi:hypothetical protein
VIIGSGVFVIAAAAVAIWSWGKRNNGGDKFSDDDSGPLSGYFRDDNGVATMVGGYGMKPRNEVSGMLFGGPPGDTLGEMGAPLLLRGDLSSFDNALDGGPPVNYIPSALQRMGGSGSGGATGPGGVGMQDAVRTEREASADLNVMANDGVDDDALMDAEDRAMINMRHNQQANQIMLALSSGDGNGIGGFSASAAASPAKTSRRGRLTWDLPEDKVNGSQAGERGNNLDTAMHVPPRLHPSHPQ